MWCVPISPHLKHLDVWCHNTSLVLGHLVLGPGAPFLFGHIYLCSFQLPCLCKKDQRGEIDVTSRILVLGFSWYFCSKHMALPSMISLNFSKYSYIEATLSCLHLELESTDIWSRAASIPKLLSKILSKLLSKISNAKSVFRTWLCKPQCRVAQHLLTAET